MQKALVREGCSDWFAPCGIVVRRHLNVDVLEDLARSDAEHAIGGFDQVIALASAVLTAKMIDEAEAGGELLGVDQKTSAIHLPSNSFHGALTLILFSVVR